MVTLRPATLSDVPAIRALVYELAVYERAPEAVTVSEKDFADAGFGPNKVWDAIVAEREENSEKKIIGFALWYERFSTWKGRRMYLEDLLVTESARGAGVGRMLFEELMRIGVQKGYSGMVWQVLNWNAPAIDFYKRYPQMQMSDEWNNCSIEF